MIQNKKKNFFDFIFVSFVNSLLFNSILGFISLIFLTEFTKKIFLSLVFIEIIIISFYIIKKNQNITIRLRAPALLILLIIIHTFYLVNSIFAPIINDVGTFIYYAESFANGEIPDLNKTLGYPQLFSILWAILLKIVGVEKLEIIFIFVKLLMFIIFLIGNLVWFRLFILSKKTYFIYAFIIYNFFIFVYFDKFVGSGMREVEVATMALLLFYFVFKYKHDSQEEFLLYAVLVSVLAGNMKQSGLILIIIIAIILILEYQKITIMQYLKYITILILGLIWLIYIEYNIYLGLSGSDSPYLQKGIHQGRNLFWRVIYAFGKFSVRALFGELPFFVIPISLSIVLIYLISIKYTTHILFYFISTIYLIIWVVYYGYDLRNLGVVIPFISLLAAESIVKLTRVGQMRKLKEYNFHVNRLGYFLILLFLIFLFVLVESRYANQFFLEQKRMLQLNYDEPDRIKYLNDYIIKNDIRNMGSQFSGVLRVDELLEHVERIDLNLSGAKLFYLINRKEFEYLYIRKNGGLTNSGQVYIDNLVSSGEILLVDQDEYYYLYKFLD
jgi:hypothetical protein